VFSDGEGAEVEFLPDSVSALQAWIQKRRGLDIYLITQCDSDETETRIRELIKKEAIKGFDANVRLFSIQDQKKDPSFIGQFDT
jgi:hypothetical protein